MDSKGKHVKWIESSWKVYTTKIHTKGVWYFGFSKSSGAYTIDFFKWSLTIYKDDF